MVYEERCRRRRQSHQHQAGQQRSTDDQVHLPLAGQGQSGGESTQSQPTAIG